MAMEHPVQWTAPSPTWRALAGTAGTPASPAFRRPTLLRFAADTFMDDYIAMLDVDPFRLGEFTARPETWRGPLTSVQPTAAAPLFARALQRKRLASLRASATGATAVAEAPLAETPALKLYQPSHQRYYLVTASLVCQLPGLPDRALDPARQERATFVIRRLIPKSGVTRPTADPKTADEYAYVSDASGTGWRRVTPDAAASVAAGEEQLPLFKSPYVSDDGKRRSVLAGLVPVSRREAYLHATPMTDPAGAASGGGVTAAAAPQDARLTLLQKQVTEPWKQLLARAKSAEDAQKAAGLLSSSDRPTQSVREATRRGVREQIQTVSWYVLLDLAKYLEAYVPNAWHVVAGTGAAATAAEQALATAIAATVFTRDGVTRTMKSALVAITARESQLEQVTGLYTEGSSGWPSERFSLATVRPAEQLVGGLGAAPAPLESISGLDPLTLESLVKAAMPATATGPMPETPLATRPVLAPGDAGWFVIRCVYERPRCAPFHPTVVSDPSEVFQLAGFFDPDAPARPIRIGLPIDVTPAGLRKFDKNTAFMVSDVLCGHIKRFKALTLGDLVMSVLPWPFHRDLPTGDSGPCIEGGMMCSLSIPIVTICALLLMMIIVSLLDFVFRWMPYLMVCFPVPGFKGKENA